MRKLNADHWNARVIEARGTFDRGRIDTREMENGRDFVDRHCRVKTSGVAAIPVHQMKAACLDFTHELFAPTSFADQTNDRCATQQELMRYCPAEKLGAACDEYPAS